MKHTYEYHQKPFTIELVPTGRTYQASIAGQSVSVEVVRMQAERLDLLIDGQACCAYITREGAKRWVTIQGQTYELVKTSLKDGYGGQRTDLDGKIAAQMAGLVRAVMVSEGQPVKKGQTLAVIEAMKMEHKLIAPFDGQVKKFELKVGQSVEREQVLFEINRLVETDTGPLTPTGSG